MWGVLRGAGLDGFKFRRQQPLGRYIADFCCHSAKLVVEIDGSVHEEADAREYDAIRDDMIVAYGYRVLRISVSEVETDIESALRKIWVCLQD